MRPRKSPLGTVVAVLAVAISTAVLSEEPRGTAPISPYLVLEQSRDGLIAAYPALPARELDLLVFRVSDINSMTKTAMKGPSGDWSCSSEMSPAGTLTMRATSYVFTRAGQAMAGEYQYGPQGVIVVNGPLKGIGIERGELIAGGTARLLEFENAGGTALHCREVSDPPS